MKPSDKSERDRAAAGAGSLDAALRGRSSGPTGDHPAEQPSVKDILTGRRSAFGSLIAEQNNRPIPRGIINTVKAFRANQEVPDRKSVV